MFLHREYFQVPGIESCLGAETKLSSSTRINRRAPDQRLKSKSKRGRARLARLASKKLAREERLRKEKLLRDWLREWPCEDLPTVPAVNKAKWDPTAHHGKEEVTAEVRRILGRSFKAKIKTKDCQKERRERDQAEQMRRSHKEQERLGSNYKAGSKNVVHEDRPGKAKQEKMRRKKLKTVKESKVEEEPKIKTGEEVKSPPTVSPVKSPVISQTANKQSYSEETRGLTEVTSGGEECDGVMPDLTDNQDGSQPTFAELYYTKVSQNTYISSTVKYPATSPPTVSSVKSPVDSQSNNKQSVPEETGDLREVSSGGEECVEEEVNIETDQQPSDDDLTQSSSEEEEEECDNHLQPPYHLRLEAKINAKRVRPDQPDLTEDSEDEEDQGRTGDKHLQPPYHLRIKAKVNAKRVARHLPDLTDDSGDEEADNSPVIYLTRPESHSSDEEEETGQEDGIQPTFAELYYTTVSQNTQNTHPASSSSPKALGDLGGGGNPSQETSQSFLEVSAMLEALESTITRKGLPLKLDRRTPAEGNCFSHSVVQQCQRPLVKEELRRQGKTITTYMDLKRDVRQFVLDRQEHPRIKAMKANFEQKQGQLAQASQPTRGWSTYWDDMLENGEWADDTFVQATAFYLSLDIFLVIADSATFTQLFHPISGDIESDRVGSSERPTLLIGYISNQHYQSLLLSDEEPSRPSSLAPQAVDDTLRRAFSALQLQLVRQSRQVGCRFVIILHRKNSIFNLCYYQEQPQWSILSLLSF